MSITPERLRQHAERESRRHPGSVKPDPRAHACWVAADEIERLRAARDLVLSELDLMLSDDPMVRQNTAKVIRANLE